MRSATILVPYESWAYLHDTSFYSKAGKHHNQKFFESAKKQFEHNTNGVENHQRMMIGYPVDMEYTLEQMKALLDKAGLPWEDGPEVEHMSI